MAISNKIRVGIVGVSPNRGFASIAHIPALQALPDFEISAVCTTRQDSAEAATRHFGVPLAFSDAEKLAQHPDIDLVTVSVKVPDHYLPVTAATQAGKHVYCEWPLGRDTDEATRMLAAAERKGIRHAVGLQGQMSPAINYTKDLIAEGYVGRVLSATMIGCAPNWGRTIDRGYQADFANGANLLTITGGHTIDALCYCLGEFRELDAFVVSPTRPHTCRGNRRTDRKDRARPTRRERYCQRRCRRILSNPWRHEPRDSVPVRNPRRRGRSPALTRLHAAAGTECERSAR
jgi:predicted dehydrogenase